MISTILYDSPLTKLQSTLIPIFTFIWLVLFVILFTTIVKVIYKRRLKQRVNLERKFMSNNLDKLEKQKQDFVKLIETEIIKYENVDEKNMNKTIAEMKKESIMILNEFLKKSLLLENYIRENQEDNISIFIKEIKEKSPTVWVKIYKRNIKDQNVTV